ncbi:PepSY domain-containing protein [Povalibacter sp.]|uniref:PepSY domain-containing protein n=1 Tax=Povalibacter sp. TaxID=1962978 RepID=UPI002F3F7C09
MSHSNCKSLRTAVLAGVLVVTGGVALAQTQTTTPVEAADVLSIADIESRLVAQGIRIEEIELRDLVVEVEGRDANGREVELLVDRRTGEILSREMD